MTSYALQKILISLIKKKLAKTKVMDRTYLIGESILGSCLLEVSISVDLYLFD